jgi:hypothetical protein
MFIRPAFISSATANSVKMATRNAKAPVSAVTSAPSASPTKAAGRCKAGLRRCVGTLLTLIDDGTQMAANAMPRGTKNISMPPAIVSKPIQSSAKVPQAKVVATGSPPQLPTSPADLHPPRKLFVEASDFPLRTGTLNRPKLPPAPVTSAPHCFLG